MIDEQAFAATLRALGSDVVVPPEPAAAARRRAARVHRRRLATGTALTAAVLLIGAGAVAGMRPNDAGTPASRRTAPAWEVTVPASGITGWAADQRPTSRDVTIVAESTEKEGPYRIVVYPHDDQICMAILDVAKAPIAAARTSRR